MDSGFRKRTVNNSLITRQLILITRGCKNMINTMGTPACTFKQLWDNVVLSKAWFGVWDTDIIPQPVFSIDLSSAVTS